jgi:hypothetical protein
MSAQRLQPETDATVKRMNVGRKLLATSVCGLKLLVYEARSS